MKKKYNSLSKGYKVLEKAKLTEKKQKTPEQIALEKLKKSSMRFYMMVRRAGTAESSGVGIQTQSGGNLTSISGGRIVRSGS